VGLKGTSGPTQSGLEPVQEGTCMLAGQGSSTCGPTLPPQTYVPGTEPYTYVTYYGSTRITVLSWVQITRKAKYEPYL
jgi:hypothetical protein